MTPRRFRVAFSFAGEKRGFVAQVAAILAKKFSPKEILYDKFHEAEFARHDLGIYLAGVVILGLLQSIGMHGSLPAEKVLIGSSEIGRASCRERVCVPV